MEFETESYVGFEDYAQIGFAIPVGNTQDWSWLDNELDKIDHGCWVMSLKTWALKLKDEENKIWTLQEHSAP